MFKRSVKIDEIRKKKSPYIKKEVNFSIVSSKKYGRKQLTVETTCREYLNRNIWEKNTSGGMVSTNVPSHGIHAQTPMSFMRLYLLVNIHGPRQKHDKKVIKRGIKALNLIEDNAGWRRSMVVPAKTIKSKSSWLFTGPAGWISQPQLLSIYTWIIRLMVYEDCDENVNVDVSSFKGFIKSLKTLEVEGDTIRCITEQGGSRADFNQTPSLLWDKLHLLTCHKKDIFGHMKIKDSWAVENTSAGIIRMASGIHYFIIGNAFYSKDIKKAFSIYKKLYTENK